MLSAKQIQKIQRKTGRVFDERKKKRDEQKEREDKKRLELLITIKLAIQKIEKANPDRGACFCVYDKKVYGVKNNKTIVIPDVTEDSLKEYSELIDKFNDRKYYMLKEKVHKDESKFFKWVSENYAHIKFNTHKISSAEEGAKALEAMAQLGGVMQEFRTLFPNRTILDLKSVMDAITEGLQSL